MRRESRAMKRRISMRKPENCSRCKGLGDKPENLVNFLHNPIAPYFSSAYVTIISVVCGIALAAVFYMAVEQQIITKDEYHPIIIWEFIIVITSTAVTWHGYINIIQYKAWPISLYDTVIPIGFSVIIIALALSVEDIRWFSFVFSMLCLMGAGAYKHSLFKLSKGSSMLTYKSHFNSYGDKFYLCLYNRFIRYLSCRFYFFNQLSAFFLILSGVEFIFTSKHYDGLDSCILCIGMTSSVWYFFIYDLNSELKKIKCLSEYY